MMFDLSCVGELQTSTCVSTMILLLGYCYDFNIVSSSLPLPSRQYQCHAVQISSDPPNIYTLHDAVWLFIFTGHAHYRLETDAERQHTRQTVQAANRLRRYLTGLGSAIHWFSGEVDSGELNDETARVYLRQRDVVGDGVWEEKVEVARIHCMLMMMMMMIVPYFETVAGVMVSFLPSVQIALGLEEHCGLTIFWFLYSTAVGGLMKMNPFVKRIVLRSLPLSSFRLNYSNMSAQSLYNKRNFQTQP